MDQDDYIANYYAYLRILASSADTDEDEQD